MVIDVEAFLAQVAATNQTVTSMNPNTEAADFVAENASHIRSMLAALLTRGMNHDIDRICHDILKIPAASTILGSVRYVLLNDERIPPHSSHAALLLFP